MFQSCRNFDDVHVVHGYNERQKFASDDNYSYTFRFFVINFDCLNLFNDINIGCSSEFGSWYCSTNDFRLF